MKVELLKSKIKEKGLKFEFIAGQLNLSKQGFSSKINGANEFKWSEIRKIATILELTPSEREKIFFS